MGGDEVVPEQPLEETEPNTFIKTETINLTPGYSEETKEYWAAQGKTLDGVDPEMTLWTVTSEMQMVDSATSNVITHQDEVTWEDTGEKTASIWVLTPDFYLIVNANAGDEDAADVTDYFYNATEELTVEGQKYIFEITKATCEGHYDFYVDSVVIVTFEGIYYEEGNKPNTSSQDTEPVQEPIEETIQEPIEEIVPEPKEDIDENSFSKSYGLEFSEGIQGFTDKYIYSDDETKALNLTHFVSANGNEMNFSWEGPVEIGEYSTENEDMLGLFNKTNDRYLMTWSNEYSYDTYSELLNLPEDTWKTYAIGTGFEYKEDGFCIIKHGKELRATYQITGSGFDGFMLYLVDSVNEVYYVFVYVEKSEIFDFSRALEVVESIEYWDYIQEQ